MIEMNKTSCKKHTLARWSVVLVMLWLTVTRATALETSDQNVVILGDSISAAYGMATEDGWVALLQKKLDDQALAVNVINASVTGDTTSNGLARLPDLLTEYQPALVIIELGGNDGLRGLSVKNLKNNLQRMADMSKDVGSDVIIVSVQLPGNYGKAYNKLFGEAFTTAAEETDSTLVSSLFEGMSASPKWFQSDGIHPNETAQPVMLDNIWQAAEPILEALSVNR